MDSLVDQFWNLIQPKLEALVVSAVEAGIKKYSSQVAQPTGLPLGKFLTFEQVRGKIDMSAPTVRKLLKQGHIVGIQIGRQWRITEKALQEYFDREEERLMNCRIDSQSRL